MGHPPGWVTGISIATKPTSAERRAERSFIDINILIYAEASDLPEKQRTALALLKQLYEGTNGVLSTQVLQEYCSVAIKKLKLPPEHIRAQLDLYEQFEVATPLRSKLNPS